MTVTSIREAALEVAKRNVFGEEGANNSGKFIEAMGGRPGSEWCGLYQHYNYRRAYEISGRWPPAWLYRRKGVPETGAKRLVKNLAAVGRSFMDPMQARPGDLVCWSRGTLGWQGHVGMVVSVDEDGIIKTLEGNVGKFPAKVKYLTHDVTKERLYMFASLEKYSPGAKGGE